MVARAARPLPHAFSLACRVVALYAPLGPLARCYVAARLLTAPMIAVARHVPAEGEVLDVGCGWGIFAHVLHLTGPGRRVLGVDVSEKRVARARRSAAGLAGLAFEVCKPGSLPALRVPVVAVFDVLHHMTRPEQEQLLLQAREAMAPGGLLLVKDLDERPAWKHVYHYTQDRIVHGLAPVFLRTREGMTALLESLHLDVQTVPLGRFRPYPHVLYLCRGR